MNGRAVLLCVLIATIANPLSAFSLGSGTARHIPRIAFNYHPLREGEIAFLSRFDMVVTHDLLEESAVRRLKSRGAKLAFYEWLPALYYGANPDGWRRLVYQNKDLWTLDPGDQDPDPMGKRNGNRDFFYDMADDGLIKQRVSHLTSLARRGGYDGIFFDWGSGWHSLVEYDCRFATDRFQKRHPGVDYDARVADFLKKLKRNGLLIVLNGGFRSPGARLDAHADVDIVESMFTTDRCDTAGRIVTGEGKEERGCETWFNSVSRSVELASRLPAGARKANPGLDFLFLNYAFPYHAETGTTHLLGGRREAVRKAVPDRQAIYYALALSYLGGAAGFTSGSDVSLHQVLDTVYFHDIGKPQGEHRILGEGMALRFFSKGFVIVADRDASVTIELPRQTKRVTDLFSGQRLPVRGGKAALSLTSQIYPSGKTYPIGRIFVYES